MTNKDDNKILSESWKDFIGEYEKQPYIKQRIVVCSIKSLNYLIDNYGWDAVLNAYNDRKIEFYSEHIERYFKKKCKI